jgi:8-oxo-dGTP diphosphatase
MTAPLYDCLQREVREELALDLQVGPVLVVDWVLPHGPWDDLLAFVFDGGVLAAERIAAIRLLDGELDRYELLSPAEAGHLLNPRGRQRLHAALAALGGVPAMPPISGMALRHD